MDQHPVLLNRHFLFLLVFLSSVAIPARSQKQGLQAIDSMVASLKGIPDDTNRAKLLYRIGDRYTLIDPGKSMSFAREGMALARRLDWKKGIAAFHISLGNLFSDAGHYDSAVDHYKLAYVINGDIGNKKGILSALQNIGSAYQRQGHDREAADYFFRALPVAEAIGDTGNISLIDQNIATVYLDQNNPDRAMDFAVQSLRAAERLPGTTPKGLALLLLGKIHQVRNDTLSSVSCYQQALSLLRQVDDSQHIADIYSSLAGLTAASYREKITLRRKAQDIWDRSAAANSNSITNLGNMGITYLDWAQKETGNEDKRVIGLFDRPGKRDLLDSADHYLSFAVKLAAATGDINSEAYFTGRLAGVKEAEGNYPLALSQIKRHYELTDSLYSQDTKNKIAERESRREVQLREKELQVKDLQLRQLWLYGLLVIFVIGMSLLVFLNRSRLRQTRLQNALQQQLAEQERRDLVHQHRVSESELKAIRAQMNPHFIYNVLNSIESYVVENDARTASRLIQKFAALSRLVLENSIHSSVSLDREWKALKLYAELEAIRFNHRFAYLFAGDEELDLRKLAVPPMMVQPLIENAIHHGLLREDREDGLVTVSLRQTGQQVVFVIRDNGVGFRKTQEDKRPHPVKRRSMALQGIKERIQAINITSGYTVASLVVRDLAEEGRSGTEVILTLPLVNN